MGVCQAGGSLNTIESSGPPQQSFSLPKTVISVKRYYARAEFNVVTRQTAWARQSCPVPVLGIAELTNFLRFKTEQLLCFFECQEKLSQQNCPSLLEKGAMSLSFPKPSSTSLSPLRRANDK